MGIINLEVENGELLSVIGTSGCGKSTMLNIVALLGQSGEGSVIIGTPKYCLSTNLPETLHEE